MSLLKTLLPLLLLAVITAGQVFEGDCPDIPAKTGFSYENFTYGSRNKSEAGSNVWWLHQQRGVMQDPIRNCSYDYNYPLPDGWHQFFRQYVRISDGKTIRGSVLIKPVENGVAHFNITDTYDDFGENSVAMNHGIDLVAADPKFDKFAIFFHCRPFKKDSRQRNYQVVLIFGRDKDLAIMKNDIDSAMADLETKHKLYRRNIMTIPNKDCPLAMEPSLNMKNGLYERDQE